MLFAAGFLVSWGPSAEGSVATTPRYITDHVSEDLLPQSTIVSIVQTHDGYLWLGTLYGLVRFNGLTFKVFDESDTPGLASGQIVRLFEDSKDNLWIGTQTAGAAVAKDGRVISLDLGRGSPQGRLAAACEDSAGAVWLYTVDGQLCRCRNGQTNVFRLEPGECRAMAAERNGLVWVGTDRVLRGIDPAADLGPTDLPLKYAEQLPSKTLDLLLASASGGCWRFIDGHIQKWLGTNMVRDLGAYPWSGRPYTACEDLQGNPIVGTYGQGLYWFDAQGKSTCLSTNDGLSDSHILSLQVDKEGCLWVGTASGGLNRVQRKFVDTLKDSEGSAVQSVSEDENGGLWFGSTQTGAHYWRNGVLSDFPVVLGDRSHYVRSVFVDRAQHVWAGTWSGGLYILQSGTFRPVPGMGGISQEISAIHQDRNGILWVGTQGGLAWWDGRIWRLLTAATTPPQRLSSNVIRAIDDDADGNIWIGTYAGLDCLRDGRITACPMKDGQPVEHISSLCVDSDGVLWVGTDGRGLARYYRGKWTCYTTRDGLISNSIGYLLEDSDGGLWIGSNAGLMRAPRQGLNDVANSLTNFITCHAYGKRSGLPTSECTAGSQPAACRARDGKLWFPTTKGLVSVDPTLLVPNNVAPSVVIEAVFIDEDELNANSLRGKLPTAITVPANRERLEIQYASLNLSAADRVRFKYRLEGHETQWTPAGNALSAHYTKLPPATYLFHVIACNEDGVWNEQGASLTIKVLPPFWRTWWFISVATACLLGMIVGVVHYVSTQRLQQQLAGLRQQQALEQERARIARDIHDQVGASLTQVSLLGEMIEGDKDSPEEIEAHAQQISQTARETARSLDEIVWTVNPSNDTLDGLINYICKYAQEYFAVAGLRYRLEVPPQLPSNPVSPEVRHNVFLAAKESITNIVKHARAEAAWVRLRVETNAVILEIQDDGRGPGDVDSAAAQARNGLRNMRKRMEDVGGKFEIGPAPERGTLVRLTVPIANR